MNREQNHKLALFLILSAHNSLINTTLGLMDPEVTT